MNGTVRTDPAEEVLVARLLSLALAPPDPEATAGVADLARALLDLGPSAGDEGPLGTLVATAESLDHDELAAEYEEVFGGAVRCSPYAGSYDADPFRQARRMADLAGLYRAFGAELGGPAAERADHVGCELEFLAYLGLRHCAAVERGLDEERTIYERAERVLLEEHLGAFLPALAADVRATTRAPFYLAAAELGERFIRRALCERDLHPRVRGGRMPGTPVDGDELTCGDGGCPAGCPARPAAQ